MIHVTYLFIWVGDVVMVKRKRKKETETKKNYDFYEQQANKNRTRAGWLWFSWRHLGLIYLAITELFTVGNHSRREKGCKINRGVCF